LDFTKTIIPLALIAHSDLRNNCKLWYMTPCAANTKCLETHYEALLDMFAWFEQRVDIRKTLDPGMNAGLERPYTLFSSLSSWSRLLNMNYIDDEGEGHKKQWHELFSGGAQSYRLWKTGSAHCYLRISCRRRRVSVYWMSGKYKTQLIG